MDSRIWLYYLRQVFKRKLLYVFMHWKQQAVHKSTLEKYQKIKSYATKLARIRIAGKAPKIEIKTVRDNKNNDIGIINTAENKENSKPPISSSIRISRKSISKTNLEFTLGNVTLDGPVKENPIAEKRNSSVPLCNSASSLLDKLKTDIRQKALRAETPKNRKIDILTENFAKKSSEILKIKHDGVAVVSSASSLGHSKLGFMMRKNLLDDLVLSEDEIDMPFQMASLDHNYHIN